jgi:hypothetical protein
MVRQHGKATNKAQGKRRRAAVPVRRDLITSITDTAPLLADCGDSSSAARHSNFLRARLGFSLHAISTEFGGLHASFM